jgi:hypothetical protein
MRGDAYVLLTLKQLAARGSLFLFVRTHHHLEYYFRLNDTRLAANEQNAAAILDQQSGANVVAIRGGREPWTWPLS